MSSKAGMAAMVATEPEARLKIAYEEYVCEVGAMDDKINLAEKLALLDGPFQPGIVGFLNDYKLAVVKVLGEFVWHTHDDTDDFFLVLSGRLTIQLRDRDVQLSAGELFVVPRGVEHRPRADEEAHVLLIEPRGTVNTGDAGGELTQPERVI
jgi:mannose-6-phosphate isomerase-like protein (cupin superfamily)